MELGAVASTSTIGYFAHALSSDGAMARASQVVRDANARNGAANSIGDAAAAHKDPRTTRDAQKADATATNSSPQIQFKDSEGTRVMEVFDSKNVLIYQVPPKGLLMLIHSQEHQRATQLETTA